MATQELPRLYSQSAAAQLAGVSIRTLKRLADEHEVFKGAAGTLQRRVFYHADQIALMQKVLIGTMDAETAGLAWRVARGPVVKRA